MTRRLDIASTARTGALALACGALLSGCVDIARSLAPDPVDTTSAVAAEVKAASRADLPTPKFSDVPPRPADVRNAAAYKKDVRGAVVARRRLDADVAANPTLTSDPTEAFALQAEAALAAAQASLPSLDETADTESFAQSARDRAAPPAASK